MVHLNVDSGLDGDNVRRSGSGSPWKPAVRAGLLMCFLVSMACVMVLTTQRQRYALPVEGAAWSAVAQPYSVVDPTSLGLHAIDRGVSSKPGPIFDSILKKDPTVPLPTNSWCENLFLGSTRGPTNKVYQLPYVIDTDTHGGTRQVLVYSHHNRPRTFEPVVSPSLIQPPVMIRPAQHTENLHMLQGVDTHPAHVQANDRMVMMTYESRNGMHVGAVEAFQVPHHDPPVIPCFFAFLFHTSRSPPLCRPPHLFCRLSFPKHRVFHPVAWAPVRRRGACRSSTRCRTT